MVPELVVRADAGPAIGVGHVMRCLALAEAWRALGGAVTFVTSCEAETLRKRIASFGMIDVPHRHPDPRDAKLLRDSLAARPGARVVIDGYGFDAEYQDAARANGNTLLVIDDIGHMPRYSADLILNQNVAAADVRYGEGIHLLLGPKYAMLRREFTQRAGVERAIPARARRVLVTFGGADPENVTARACRAIAATGDAELEARVVVGASNPHGASLRAIARECGSKIDVLPATDEMPELMAWADVAIGAGGSTCWELAFLGVPSIIVVLAENQGANAEGLAKAGVAVNVGTVTEALESAMAAALTELVGDASRRADMRDRGTRLVDGQGAERVARRLLESRARRA